MAKKKKKNLKAHFLHLSQKQSLDGNQTVNANYGSAPIFNPITPISDEHKYDQQFGHVLPDLKFFGLMVVLMAVCLGVIYYFDQSGNVILFWGQKIYKILHLS